MEEKALLGGRLLVRSGDITRERAEAIVNAANSSLLGGGGVDGAIHRRGGPEILASCREIRRTRYPDGLPTGEAVATVAGRLPASCVIHTVGPVWRGGGAGEAELLARCYRRCLEEASGLKLRTVAFPAVSTGVYGYPKDRAARVSYEAVREYLRAHELPETVIFVFFSPEDAAVFLQSIPEEE